MWESIIKGVLGSFLSFFKDIWKEERAFADSYEARSSKEQLESIREGIQKEKEIAKEVDKVEPVLSPADWASRAILLAMLLPLLGCFRFHVFHAAYRPVPPAIGAPTIQPPTEGDLTKQMDALRSEQEVPFSAREVSIFTYAAKLEKAYKLIRQDAIEANRDSGYPVTE